MIQLLLHLWGDYVFQPGKWAVKKRTDIRYTALHAIFYMFPFILASNYHVFGFHMSILAFSVMLLTHIIIDRYYPARYIIFAKNWIVERHLRWKDCSKTGYSPEMPAWMAVWLMIIVDNLMHLSINYAALELL